MGNGLLLEFSEPLNAETAQDTGSYGVTIWNYRYGAAYGSKDWSIRDPQKQRRDEIEVRSARLLPGEKRVFLEMPDLQPAMQCEVKYSLSVKGGSGFQGALYTTLHRLAAPLTP